MIFRFFKEKAEQEQREEDFLSLFFDSQGRINEECFEQRKTGFLGLSKLGREKAQESFARFIQARKQKPLSEILAEIRKIDLGEGQRTDLVQRSFYSRLLVWAAREVSDTKNPWQTVKKERQRTIAKDEEQVSVLEALDRRLMFYRRAHIRALQRMLGKQRAKEMLDRWEEFWQSRREKKQRPELPGKKISRRAFLRGAIVAALLLGLKGEPGPQLSESGEQKPSSYESVGLQEPDREPQTQHQQTESRPLEERSFEETEPQGELEPQPEAHPEQIQAPVIELLPQTTITLEFYLDGSDDLEQISLPLVDAETFDEPDPENYYKGAPSGQLYFGTGQGQTTTLLLHSGRFRGEALPGQKIVEDLKSGDSLIIQDNKGNQKEFVLEAVILKEADVPMDSITTPLEILNQDLPELDESREQGTNILVIITCDPQSYSQGHFQRRTFLFFVPHE